MNDITMTLVRETHKDLQELIAKLDDYLSTLYPAEGIFGLDLADPKVREMLFVVAYHDGQPVGCGAIRPLDAESVEIKRFFVDVPYRNRGVASRILLFLEEQAKTRGYRFSRLETGEPQKESVHFYKKLGYAQIEPFGEYIGSEYSLCFEKSLTS
ncbi:N-acetylglutamate synthase, GNAT family [Paenibacillus sp. cl141a]|uniref:GNAT family N-acetyltransferase n=1 Tax=Paenibacillus sp. cl141a TaxID=1761877 RepID=UPI0008C976D8|nr:GNAT family N-acetyltransferase [Paenibacillus sp. cl141a]SEL65917.1 N-acetylglutamate synthase, GNAT family [Paenibacillus sp. cl141a]